MPTYEYYCDNCKNQWEVEQRITETPIEECPLCLTLAAKRLISKSAFILKGSGWAADSYTKSTINCKEIT